MKRKTFTNSKIEIYLRKTLQCKKICCDNSELNGFIGEFLQLFTIWNVFELLFVVFLLVHVKEISVTAVSWSTLWFLKLMRHF